VILARSAHLLKRFCLRVGDIREVACTMYRNPIPLAWASWYKSNSAKSQSGGHIRPPPEFCPTPAAAHAHG